MSQSQQINLPTWLLEARQECQRAFLNQGMPTRQNERWKYADLAVLKNSEFPMASPPVMTDAIKRRVLDYQAQFEGSYVAVFVDGFYQPSLSSGGELPDGVIVTGLDVAENSIGGLFLYVPDGVVVSTPIHCLAISTSLKPVTINMVQTLALGKHSKVLYVEEYMTLTDQPYRTNVTTSLHMAAEAWLEYCKVQQEQKDAVHIANTFVYQQQNSNSDFINFSTGGCFSRDEIIVKLREKGADCHTSGFYQLTRDNQYIDHHVDIIHDAPQSNSEMLYKGVLTNKSRAVFNGRLYVAKDSQRIVAHQANHNLLLSNQSEAYSKPELEIYADDVKCKHGATVGQLDQDALFYLCSRGIPRHEAFAMLLQGFAKEVTQRLSHSGLKSYILARLLSEDLCKAS